VLTFIYKCPVTALNGQGHVPRLDYEEQVAKGHHYQSLTCTVCGGAHLVDPRTGKVAGSERD
jgi:hypothetical protein